MSACGKCKRSLGDGTELCVDDAGELARALAGVPDLLTDLDITLTRQDRLGEPAHGSGETLLVWKAAVPDVLWVLADSVIAWARDVAHQRGIPLDPPPMRPIRGSVLDRETTEAEKSTPRCEQTGLPTPWCACCRADAPAVAVLPPDAVPSRPRAAQPAPVLGARPVGWVDELRHDARWLVRHIDQFRQLPGAAQGHEELTSAIEQANAACSAPPLRLFVGACDAPLGHDEPVLDNDGTEVLDADTGEPVTVQARCREDLYGYPDHRAVRCPRCSTLHSSMLARWYSALRRLEGYPATAATIGRAIGELYGLTTVDLRKKCNRWHSDGELRMVDRDCDGAPRFRIGEVLKLARQGDRRRKSAGQRAG